MMTGFLAARRADVELAVAAAVMVARTGLAHPVRPTRLARMGLALRRNGTSLATLSAVAAARWPDHVAIVDERGTLTYAELDRRVEALAAALADEYGIGPDRPLALMCRNHRGFVESLLAAARLGADVLLLNTDFPGPQLAQVLARHDLGVVICDEEFMSSLDSAGFAGSRVIAWHDDPAEVSVDSLVLRNLQWRRRPARAGKVILLTSGTTGTPKGASRAPSARDVAGAGVTALKSLGLRVNEPLLVGPPLFHGFGMAQIGIGMILGSTIVLHRRFDPEVTLASIAKNRVVAFATVPVMMQRILQLPEEVRVRYDTGSLRAVLSGAAPLSPVLAIGFMDAFGDVVFNGYGSSEVGIATIATPADLRAAPGTVGRPALDTVVRILDDAGVPVPAGDVGTIFVGGPMVFDGYTGGGSKAMVGDLMNTGDRGYLDLDGRLFIAGREDDMIVSGGENVYPQEVENVLRTHEAIADAAVFGVDDAEFGQRLKAFVVAKPGTTPTVEQLKAHVKTSVARYKVPREIVFIDEIPRNPTGKVQRKLLFD